MSRTPAVHLQRVGRKRSEPERKKKDWKCHAVGSPLPVYVPGYVSFEHFRKSTK